MFFRDIVGQEEIKTRLIRSVKEGRVAHAQLFYGISGVGTLPMALAYAQYITCENPSDEDSCGLCPSCRKHKQLSHPDLHLVFPIIKKKSSSDEGSVSDEFLALFREQVLSNPYLSLQDWQEALDDAKKPVIYTKEGDEIIRKLGLKSFESPYKVMIIWCAEQMHEACANKVLKVLEEPQGQTIFLLVSDNIENILLTIRSRVQQLFFPPIDDKSLRLWLEDKAVGVKDITRHIKNAKGSLNALQKEIAQDDTKKYYFQLFVKMMRVAWALTGKTFVEWRGLVDELSGMGRASQIIFLQSAQRLLRENFVYNLCVEQLIYMNLEEREFAEKFSRFIHERNIEGFVFEFALAERQIGQNINSKFVFMDLMLKVNLLLKVVNH